MGKQIIILSGPVGAGKSTLAKRLTADYGMKHFRTSEALCNIDPKIQRERRSLQEFGDKLDIKTNGEWVRNQLRKQFPELDTQSALSVVIDAVRIKKQIDAIRKGYGGRVFHVHLTAPLTELQKRYKRRSSRSRIEELSTYDDVRNNNTEKEVDELAAAADVVINTQQCTEDDVVVRVACHLGLHGRECRRTVDVIVGGQFGSEGKGQIAAYLASEYDLLIRVGGPNAGHTVYEEPTPYVFHQLPSGTRANSSARIMIGAGAVISIPQLQREIADCQLDVKRLSIDPQAIIITDEDRAAESDLKSNIGSTGQGVGFATARKILSRGKNVTLAKDVPDFKPFIKDTCRLLDDEYCRGSRILLEGTQGTGLSIHHGKYPFVTSRDTTVSGCLAEAGIGPHRVRKVMMVCRTFPIRVQSPAGKTSGPFSHEISWQEVSRRSALSLREIQQTEITSTTRRERRVGEFDWSLLRRAVSLNAPTDIALTFVDYLNADNKNARRFDQLDDVTLRFIDEVECVASAPVSLISTRFHSRAIIDRRTW